MRYHRFVWLLSILLFVSCGKDNDDFLLPEDIVNLDREIGITFGVVSTECRANCITTYKISDEGVFSSDASMADFVNPNNVIFNRCPISEQVRFISRVEGLNNVPRGLRDIESRDLASVIAITNSPQLYFVMYTVSGMPKSVVFSSVNTLNDQVRTYFESVITVIESLNNQDTTPIDACDL